LLAKILAEIHQFSGRQEFSDDLCVPGVEVRELKN
jgi:hypothetical protein